MSEAKHTSARWYWACSDPQLTRPVALTTEDSDILTVVVDEDGPCLSVSPKVSRAIVAVPEMLAMLRRLEYVSRPGCEDACPCCQMVRSYPGGHRDTCDLAALLRRVEGEGDQ